MRSERIMPNNVFIPETAEQIADQLGETHLQACQKIEQIVATCGIEQALAWMEETLSIEAGGGLMVSTGERRRTLGGVFFYVVRGQLPKALRKQLFPFPPKKRKKKSPTPPAAQELPVEDAVTEPVSDSARRLEELRNAEKEAQERLATIQALPPSERTGLMSAMRDLQRIRAEIKALNG